MGGRLLVGSRPPQGACGCEGGRGGREVETKEAGMDFRDGCGQGGGGGDEDRERHAGRQARREARWRARGGWEGGMGCDMQSPLPRHPPPAHPTPMAAARPMGTIPT